MGTVVDGRQLRGARSRARVLAAADGLLVDLGYRATTIEAVAAAAGVAPQTVYSAFGTKAGLLRAVLDARIAGDDEPEPVVGRAWFDAVAGPSTAAAVEALARASTAILARAAPVYDVVRSAAAEPEVAALLEANRRARRQDQRALAEALGAAGHLGPAVDVATAADVLYGVVHEEVFLLLTRDCGWTTERFAGWLAATLAAQLTDGPA